MKHLLYIIMVAAGALLGLMPGFVAGAIGLTATAIIAFNIRNAVSEDGWDARPTQMAVMHGAMLFFMSLMVIPGHDSFMMKALIAATSVAPIRFDGIMLYNAIRRAF